MGIGADEKVTLSLADKVIEDE